MPTLYLDVCCLNRPFDDQAQDRVRLEAEAVSRILSRVESGEWTWVASEAVVYEVDRTLELEKRTRVNLLLRGATRFVAAQGPERVRMRDLMGLGFASLDALHLACAESGGTDVFLTTDDRLLRQAERQLAQLKVRVQNPLTWLGEVLR